MASFLPVWFRIFAFFRLSFAGFAGFAVKHLAFCLFSGIAIRPIRPYNAPHTLIHGDNNLHASY
jgi:hypothetical protein